MSDLVGRVQALAEFVCKHFGGEAVSSADGTRDVRKLIERGGNKSSAIHVRLRLALCVLVCVRLSVCVCLCAFVCVRLSVCARLCMLSCL